MSEQKLSILIVDDEQVVRDSLVHWFTEEGYDLDSASNANDALAKLAGREFHSDQRRDSPRRGPPRYRRD